MSELSVSISVIVPTYRRPEHLGRCLSGIESQSRRADEVIVVARSTDAATHKVVEDFKIRNSQMQLVLVETPGVIAAMSAGLASASGYLVALTDDDAVPRPDWLQRFETTFATDSQIAGVGGRDMLHIEGETIRDREPVVGKVQWCGRVIGFHHAGFGGPREVDVLKGVNSAYRRALLAEIGFDNRLAGSGAQVGWELALGLKLRCRGWKLIYDPGIVVDHFLAERFDDDRRSHDNYTAVMDKAYNLSLILLENLPCVRKVAYTVWALLIGSRDQFGLIQLLRFAGRPQERALLRYRASLAGFQAGWRTWRKLPKADL